MSTWRVEWQHDDRYPDPMLFDTKREAENQYNVCRREGCYTRMFKEHPRVGLVLLREANVPTRERMSRVRERLGQVSAQIQANAQAFNDAMTAAIPRMEQTLGSPVRFSGTTVFGFDGSRTDHAPITRGSTHDFVGRLDLPPAWQDRIAEWADMARQGRSITLQTGRRAGQTHMLASQQRYMDEIDTSLPITTPNEPVMCTDSGCVHDSPKKEMA